MDYGLCLPNVTDAASPEGIEAAAETAERLGWGSVWTTDHLLVEHAQAANYGRVFEAIETLAWVGARHRLVRLGTSVVVVPMRNAVVLAKEIATLDALSGGRVVAGVGVGWDRLEFANVGVADRFSVRGAYLDETIRLFRHLWSGSSEPFEGRFHSFSDFVFGPLPAQRSALPILVGGSSPAALHRAGALADGYQSTSSGPADYAARVPVIREAASEAHRPPPRFGARVRVEMGGPLRSPTALRGTPDEMARQIRELATAGVEEVALYFDEADAGALVAAIERFDNEVRPLVD